MPRPCSLCGRPDRPEIELAIASGLLTYSKAARKYGLHFRSVRRHMEAHASFKPAGSTATAGNVKGVDAQVGDKVGEPVIEQGWVPLSQEEVAAMKTEESLYGRLAFIHQKTLAAVEKAENSEALSILVSGLAEMRRQAELQGKLAGRIAGDGAVTINNNNTATAVVQINIDNVLAEIVVALENHPDALEAVTARLEALEDQSANGTAIAA